MKPLARYGASPLHLLAMCTSLAVAAYAAMRLFAHSPVGIAVWLVGAAVGHDLVLFPLYAAADRALQRRTPARPLPWINHVRVPAVISGTLLLVWAPLILRLPHSFSGVTRTSTVPYLARWLGVTACLYTVSRLFYVVRSRKAGGGTVRLRRPHQLPGSQRRPPQTG